MKRSLGTWCIEEEEDIKLGNSQNLNEIQELLKKRLLTPKH